jgi:hypothetical protein
MSAYLAIEQVKNMKVSAVEWRIVANELDRIARYENSMNPAEVGQILRDFAELAARWCNERSREAHQSQGAHEAYFRV